MFKIANLSAVDFYTGAVLSHLLTSNKEHSPCFIEVNNEKRIFFITTNEHKYALRMHKCEGKRYIRKDALSWTFNLTENEIRTLKINHQANVRNVVALVMLESKKLSKSKIIYFTDKHLEAKNIYDSSRKSTVFTVKKYPNKNDYLLFLNKKEEEAIPVKQNLRLDY